jgi:hypothetical protein
MSRSPLARLAGVVFVTLVLGGLPAAASASSVNVISHDALAPWPELDLNGSATVEGGSVVQLTPNQQSQAGSAYFSGAIDLSHPFGSRAEVRSNGTPGSEADGLAFVLQSSSAGTGALGQHGGGLGWVGITPAVAVEFDTYDNGAGAGDPNSNHISIATNGTSNVSANAPFELNGPPFYTWIDYDGTTLQVYAATTDSKPATPVVSHAIDLGALLGDDAWAGWSAGTGGLTAYHEVIDWDLWSTCAGDVPCGAGQLAATAGAPRNDFFFDSNDTVRFAEQGSTKEINGTILCGRLDERRAIYVYEDAPGEPDRATPGGIVYLEDNGAGADRLRNGRLARKQLNAIKNGPMCPVALPAAGSGRVLATGDIYVPDVG